MKTVADEYFAKMGVKKPPANGEYFVGLEPFVEKQLKGTAEEGKAQSDALRGLAQRPWKAKDHPTISEWLKANERPLAAIIEATKRTHYFNPLVTVKNEKGVSTPMFNIPLPGVQAAREVAFALAARAMLSVGEGNADAAWRDLLACHRLARLVGRGPCLIEGLVCVAIDIIASQGDLMFLEHVSPDAKRLEACLRDLRALPELPNIAEKIDLNERCTLLDVFMLANREGPAGLQAMSGRAEEPHPLADLLYKDTDWDVALKIANGWYDRFAAAAGEKDVRTRYRKLEEVGEEFKEFAKAAKDPTLLAKLLRDGVPQPQATGQALGEVFTALLIPAVDRVIQGADRARQLQDNVAVAFALARYQRANNKYPQSLDALAPTYLPSVPTDAFAGKALIYKPQANGYLLHSVGVNGRDDGGRGYNDQPAGDDIVVRVPLPPRP